MWAPAHRLIAPSGAPLDAKHAPCATTHAAAGHHSRLQAPALLQPATMVFYIVGLGLADERDITVKWVAAAAACRQPPLGCCIACWTHACRALQNRLASSAAA